MDPTQGILSVTMLLLLIALLLLMLLPAGDVLSQRQRAMYFRVYLWSNYR